MMEVAYLLFWYVLENAVGLLSLAAVLGVCAWLLLREGKEVKRHDQR